MTNDFEPPTAVLMLKAPVPGQVKTRLAADLGAEAACQVYRILVEHQVRHIPPGWRVAVHHDPPEAEPVMKAWLGEGLEYRPQVCGDLGVRLAAVLTAHDFSAAPLFLLGGDCPYLESGVLDAAAEALALPSTELVLVPAVDGGYVLIGMKHPHASLFAGIDWSTDRVLRQTLEEAARLDLRVVLLERLEDVDDLASWTRAERFLNRS